MRNKHYKYILQSLLFTALLLFVIFQAKALKREVRGTRGSLILTGVDSLFLQGEFPAALSVLNDAISENPTDPVLLYNRGLLEWILERGDGLNWFRRAYQNNPENPLILWQYGLALTLRGELAEGERILRAGITRQAEFYECLTDLGYNLKLQNRLPEAAKILQSVIEQKRVYVWAFTKLAGVYNQLKEDEAELKTLHEGLAHFRYEQLLIGLIRYHQSHEAPDSVRYYADIYYKMYPLGPNIEEVSSLLTRLNGEPPKPPSYPTEPFQTKNGSVSLRAGDHAGDHAGDRAGDHAGDPAQILPLGQHLGYDVHYGPLKLGYLDIEMYEGRKDGEATWWAQYVVRTAPGLPFFTINDTFHVHIKRNLSYTICMTQYIHEKDMDAVEVYETDYNTGWMEVRTVWGLGYWEYIRQPLPPNTFDPLSMTWFAQQLILRGESDTANSMISGGYEHTIIYVLQPDRDWELAGRTWNKAIKVEGILKYAGIAGLTGDYTGWFSNDGKTLPLVSNFKIIIGSVTIRLISISNSANKGKTMVGILKHNQ